MSAVLGDKHKPSGSYSGENGESEIHPASLRSGNVLQSKQFSSSNAQLPYPVDAYTHDTAPTPESGNDYSLRVG